MQCAPVLPRRCNRSQQRRIGKQTAIRNRRIDPRHVHPHNPTRAQVQVPNLGVPHLPIRQPHKVVARPDQRIRIVTQQSVVDRLPRQRDCIPVRLGAVTPAVKDGQNDRFRHVPSRIPRLTKCSPYRTAARDGIFPPTRIGKEFCMFRWLRIVMSIGLITAVLPAFTQPPAAPPP